MLNNVFSHAAFNCDDDDDILCTMEIFWMLHPSKHRSTCSQWCCCHGLYLHVMVHNMGFCTEDSSLRGMYTLCIHLGLFFWYPCNLGTLQAEVSLLHCFSIYEVVHVACLSWGLSLFMPMWQTSHANNFVNGKSYARDKPDLLAGYII